MSIRPCFRISTRWIRHSIWRRSPTGNRSTSACFSTIGAMSWEPVRKRRRPSLWQTVCRRAIPTVSSCNWMKSTTPAIRTGFPRQIRGTSRQSRRRTPISASFSTRFTRGPAIRTAARTGSSSVRLTTADWVPAIRFPAAGRPSMRPSTSSPARPSNRGPTWAPRGFSISR